MKKVKSSLPQFLKPYFWDVEFKELNPKNHPQYIIARVLEHGNIKSLRWLLKTYSQEQISQVIYQRRTISPKTANFWALFFNLDRERVKCLQKSYLARRKKLWPY